MKKKSELKKGAKSKKVNLKEEGKIKQKYINRKNEEQTNWKIQNLEIENAKQEQKWKMKIEKERTKKIV